LGHAGLDDDVAATKRILDRQDGPCILVGHSDGGAVITEAGVDPHVAALVYIAAHEERQLASRRQSDFPAADRTGRALRSGEALSSGW
jgi:pimeloyl-ACP methyl ester carboxylesterase